MNAYTSYDVEAGLDRSGLPWTDGEIRFALRRDIRTHFIARALGRSYAAVATKRSLARADMQAAPIDDGSH